LEWDSVWIINVTDAKFPNSYFCKSDEELEEERRLFYVAITRAKKKLTIVAPMSDEEAGEYLAKGYVENSHESPFMTENPQIDKLVRTQYSGAIGSATARSPLSRRLRSEYE
jgi:superfamily I DNA/RNA helicase